MQARLVLPVSMALAAIFGAGFADLVPTSMVIKEVRKAPRVLDQHQAYASNMMFVEAPATDLSPDIAIGPDNYLTDEAPDYVIPAAVIGQGREAVTSGEVGPHDNHGGSLDLHLTDHETVPAKPPNLEDDPFASKDVPIVTSAPMS